MEGPLSLRLHAYLAKAGVCSRRAAESLVAQGRVRVDGVTAAPPGLKIVPGEVIVEVDGKVIPWKESHTYLLLNKPMGVICTARDEQGRETVLDLLPSHLGRLYPVGRLDRDSEGLLLLTDDGTLSHRLTHPKFGVAKTYRIVVEGTLSQEEEDAFRAGVALGDGKTRPADLVRLSSAPDRSEYEITLREGKKRQIRRMIHALGYRVLTLRRIREGTLTLDNLSPGQWRLLTPEEIHHLKKEVDLT